MRIHVICHGKKTTISIDDILMDYLGAWLVEDNPELHANAKRQQDVAKTYIKRYVTKMGDLLPTKNISQDVQAFIIRMIAAPGLAEIIDARGPRYKKEKPDLRLLFPDYDELAANAQRLINESAMPT